MVLGILLLQNWNHSLHYRVLYCMLVCSWRDIKQVDIWIMVIMLFIVYDVIVLLIVSCKISTLLLTDKCLQYGSHGNTVTTHMIINDLLQSCCSIMGAWQTSLSHAHLTSCLQANSVPVKIHVLKCVNNVLQKCSQWYHSQLHRYISNWQLEPFVLLLMSDLPQLLTFLEHQLIPLIESQLVGVANQLAVLVNDVQSEHEKLTKQCALIRVSFRSYTSAQLYWSLFRNIYQTLLYVSMTTSLSAINSYGNSQSS